MTKYIRQASESRSQPSIREVLSLSVLFRSLSEEDLLELETKCFLAFAAKGECIWRHGSEAWFFGTCGNGFVKMVKSSVLGQEMTLELMGPGQSFGVLGTIDGKGCPLSAFAVTDIWFLKIPKGEFQPIYQRADVLKDQLVRRTTQRLRQAHEMMSRLSSGKVSSRIAAVLLVIAESYGKPSSNGVLLDIPLTRQDIADIAGTTVESTIRVMSSWQKEGILSTEQQRITITDENALIEQLR